jgi:mono/diheme cytochrome c family protein
MNAICRAFVVIVSASVIMAGAAGCGTAQPAPLHRADPAAPAAASADTAVGRALFHGSANCYICHGPAGAGTPLGPALNDTIWISIDGSFEQVRAVIRDGVAAPQRFPAPMPSQGGARLSDAEIDALARYVVHLSRGDGR